MSGKSADAPEDGRSVPDGDRSASDGDRSTPDPDRSASGDTATEEWPPSASESSATNVAEAASESGKRSRPPRPPNEVTSLPDGPSIGDGPVTVPADPTAAGTDATGADPVGEYDRVAGRIDEGGPRVGEDLLPDHSFALCLTHDVDRPYKFAQAFFYALRDRDPSQLRSLLPGEQPNWTFDRMLELESDLGVRSAFYFLDEQRLFRDRPIGDWLDIDAWRLYADRYDVDDPAIVGLMHRLDRGGWEVGLHGSYESYDDRERLRREKRRLERAFGKSVVGGRQHYLNRTLPETWEHHAALGLRYDATLGSSNEIGFGYGDTIDRPFDDEFVAFPLTMMDVAMPDPGDDLAAAKSAADGVLRAAVDRGAIATVLWHPRVFNEDDWPGHTELYRFLIERSQELGGWVGPPRDCYAELDHPE